MESLKSLACQTIDDRAQDLKDISRKIWEKPELCYEEFAAHELLTSFLEKEGFSVCKKTPLETSFIARCGKSGGLKIGVLCEYDALPVVGHACGHNLIAEAGIAAALGIKSTLKLINDHATVQIIVYGTPAEEGGGGKVEMIEKKAFDDADICMMCHPCQVEVPVPRCLALAQLTIIFHGKASHAAAAPWEGINALDAAVACYNNFSMLRQQIKPEARVHAIIVDGGKKANIIPERSELDVYIRELTETDAYILKERIVNCAKGAAEATGCTVEVKETKPFYSAVKTNKTLINLYMNNAKLLGVKFDELTILRGSTDMGNVSQIKPSIHPFYKIKSEGSNHTRVFTDASILEENQLPTLNAGKSLAMTAIDVICNPKLFSDIVRDFNDC